MTLYSTGCPSCRLLKEKLDKFGKQYDLVTDKNIMRDKGIDKVPVLEVGGTLYSFKDALKLVEVI